MILRKTNNEKLPDFTPEDQAYAYYYDNHFSVNDRLQADSDKAHHHDS